MQECNHDVFNCVQSVPIFKHLDCVELDDIYQIAQTRSYSKGEFMYNSGDLGTALYVVYKGKIKLSRFNKNGKEQVIRIVEHGDFLGELSLFSSIELNESAEVLEDAVVCLIPTPEFQRILTKHPSISLKVLDVMSRRLESAERTIELINLNTVSQRVATVLLDLFEDGNKVELTLKKGHLASQIGTSQETLSRTLSSFQDNGIITLKGQKMIYLNDRESLIRMSESDR